MNFLLLLCTAAAAVCLSRASDLFCSCHDDRGQRSVSAHCHGGQDDGAHIKCVTAQVPEVSPGYMYVPGYALVKLFQVHQRWSDAAVVCKSNGGRLAVPPDDNAINGLKQVLQKEPAVKSAYIGVRSRQGRYLDTDGKPATLWGTEADPPRVADACCALESDQTRCGPCTDLKAFFCERRQPAEALAGYNWVAEAGRFYKLHSDQMTYPLAEQACRAENASLAVPDTWRRAEGILSVLEPRDPQYFVGLTDQAEEGVFVTQNGRRLSDMEFQNWDQDEPDNGGITGPENCLTISGPGLINDNPCGMAFPFICEILPM